ncbi:MAG: hypothetical protein FWK04_23660 [Nostoc sp. GBBB01]|nr:hypothetical protein [Nostoc sp. GBBB01]
MGIGHWALGIGHWALGIGHWAEGKNLSPMLPTSPPPHAPHPLPLPSSRRVSSAAACIADSGLIRPDRAALR